MKSLISTSPVKKTVPMYLKKIISSNKVTLLLMAIPGILLTFVFSYTPLFGWIYAFFDYKPGLELSQCTFVGLKFFNLAIQEHDFLMVMRNTLAIGFLFILVTPVPMIFAILVSEMKNERFKSLVQTVTTLPNFISWIVVYALFYAMFSPGDGFINMLLMNLHLIDNPIDPLTNSDMAWYIQTAIYLWKTIGFTAIIYLASIAGIDQELYDAANVDGAGRFKTILHVTLPGLSSTYVNLLLLSTGLILSNGFEQFYNFYNTVVQDKIQVLDYYLYRIGLMNGDYPLSTALGMSKTIVSVIILFFVNWISKRVRGSSII